MKDTLNHTKTHTIVKFFVNECEFRLLTPSAILLSPNDYLKDGDCKFVFSFP